MSESSGDSVGRDDLTDKQVAGVLFAYSRCASMWRLAREVQERRAMDAKRRCENCEHYDRPTDADPWPSCKRLAVGVDPDWFCADWEEPK